MCSPNSKCICCVNVTVCKVVRVGVRALLEARPGSLCKSLIQNGFFLFFPPGGKINEDLKQENMQALAGVGRAEKTLQTHTVWEGRK